MIDLIPEYMESRRTVSKRLITIQQEQKLAHQSLQDQIAEMTWPQWMEPTIQRYMKQKDPSKRTSELSTLKFEMSAYIHSADAPAAEIQNVYKEIGQVLLVDVNVGHDKTQLNSMKNEMAQTIMMLDDHLRISYLSQLSEKERHEILQTIRDLQSKHRKRMIYNTDWINDMGDMGCEEEVVERLDAGESKEEGILPEGVTISLSKFSGRQQEAIDLIVHGGMSLGQAGKELGISRESVATHIRHARGKASRMEGQQLAMVF